MFNGYVSCQVETQGLDPTSQLWPGSGSELQTPLCGQPIHISPHPPRDPTLPPVRNHLPRPPKPNCPTAPTVPSSGRTSPLKTQLTSPPPTGPPCPLLLRVPPGLGTEKYSHWHHPSTCPVYTPAPLQPGGSEGGTRAQEESSQAPRDFLCPTRGLVSMCLSLSRV